MISCKNVKKLAAPLGCTPRSWRKHQSYFHHSPHSSKQIYLCVRIHERQELYKALHLCSSFYLSSYQPLWMLHYFSLHRGIIIKELFYDNLPSVPPRKASLSEFSGSSEDMALNRALFDCLDLESSSTRRLSETWYWRCLH